MHQLDLDVGDAIAMAAPLFVCWDDDVWVIKALLGLLDRTSLVAHRTFVGIQ